MRPAQPSASATGGGIAVAADVSPAGPLRHAMTPIEAVGQWPPRCLATHVQRRQPRLSAWMQRRQHRISLCNALTIRAAALRSHNAADDGLYTHRAERSGCAPLPAPRNVPTSVWAQVYAQLFQLAPKARSQRTLAIWWTFECAFPRPPGCDSAVASSAALGLSCSTDSLNATVRIWIVGRPTVLRSSCSTVQSLCAPLSLAALHRLQSIAHLSPFPMCAQIALPLTLPPHIALPTSDRAFTVATSPRHSNHTSSTAARLLHLSR